MPLNIHTCLFAYTWARVPGTLVLCHYFKFLYFIQVGNAVPPPLAKAIGLEVKKAMEEKLTFK